MAQSVKGIYGAEKIDPTAAAERGIGMSASEATTIRVLTEIRDDARRHHARMKGVAAIGVFFYIVAMVSIFR